MAATTVHRPEPGALITAAQTLERAARLEDAPHHYAQHALQVVRWLRDQAGQDYTPPPKRACKHCGRPT